MMKSTCNDSDSDIQREIDFHRFENWLCGISPEYQTYRNMEENLKLISLEIEGCNNILQINDLTNKYEQLKSEIYQHLIAY